MAEGGCPCCTLSSTGPEGSSAQQAVEQLRKDVAVVGRLPFVSWVDAPVLYGAAEEDGELFQPTDETGPWLVRMRMEGGVLAHAKVNAGYPVTHPELRVVAQLHSPALGELGRLTKRPDGGLVAGVSLLNDTLAALDPQKNPKMLISPRYLPLRRHPALFEDLHQCLWVGPDSLHPLLHKALREGGLRGLFREEFRGVYSFPLFTASFCEKIMDEYDGFLQSGIESRRPNSMNRYGLILNEVGMEAALGRLQRDVLLPVARELFGMAEGAHFDHHHSFIVRYKVGEDLGLDMHTDDSDVTFNVCLGKEFQGSGLQFCGDMGAPSHRQASGNYKHEIGRCVVHLGRRRHGADDISSGERVNMIIWNTNSEFRKTHAYLHPKYLREQSAPDPVCVSYTHDRDFSMFKKYPSETAERFRGRGWCPPRHAEYPGFEAEPGGLADDGSSD
eukprot:Hpha_TRINITY_DN13527_c0_g1::TRINITY_DN13527_c0_g1_i4::g.111345::m.111345